MSCSGGSHVVTRTASSSGYAGVLTSKFRCDCGLVPIQSGGRLVATTAAEQRIAEWGIESDEHLRATLDFHTPALHTGEDAFADRCMHCEYTRAPCATASMAATALARSAQIEERDAEIAALTSECDEWERAYRLGSASECAALNELAAARAAQEAAESREQALRERIEREAYVTSRAGLRCRFCGAIDSGLYPRGRDVYEVVHFDWCILAAGPSSSRWSGRVDA